jgi:hypothetical protein
MSWAGDGTALLAKSPFFTISDPGRGAGSSGSNSPVRSSSDFPQLWPSYASFALTSPASRSNRRQRTRRAGMARALANLRPSDSESPLECFPQRGRWSWGGASGSVSGGRPWRRGSSRGANSSSTEGDARCFLTRAGDAEGSRPVGTDNRKRRTLSFSRNKKREGPGFTGQWDDVVLCGMLCRAVPNGEKLHV